MLRVNNLVGFGAGGGARGITVINSAADAVQGGDVITFNLSALGVGGGDLVLTVAGHSDSDNPIPTTAGYTSGVIFNALINTEIQRLSYAYKFMGGSPDASVAMAPAGGTSPATAAAVLILRGVDTVTPLDTAAISASGESTNPDCGSITTVTANALVVAFAVSRANDSAIDAPSGYSTPVTAAFADTRNQSVALSYLLKPAAGAENPAAFGNWSTGRWAAGTMAFRPA